VDPSRQWLHLVHRRKVTAIKGEVEKNLNVGFIYPIPLIDWDSNTVPISKRQGEIWICVDYHNINCACPKYNCTTPFIDQIIDECARTKIFYFMDGFSGYNQISILPIHQHKNDVGSEKFSFMDGFSSYNQNNILPVDQHKTPFICPWGLLLKKISLSI